MNRENSIRPEQIQALFRAHRLAEEPSITRMTAGFTNEVYTVGDYILKVCVDSNNEPHFEREIYLYQALRRIVSIPEPVVVDTSKTVLNWFYMIYPKIAGEPIGRHWHRLTDRQRRGIVEALCQQLRRIDNFPTGEYIQRFGLNPHLVWREEQMQEWLQALEIVRNQDILSTSTVQAIERYLTQWEVVLIPQQLGLTFWDVQWDNMLLNSQDQLAALLDFEGISITSIDFRLGIVRMMSQTPHRFMSEEMEPYARVEDYQSLMAWYREYYPELFEFPELEKRLDLYELGDILHKLPAWPNTKHSHNRLVQILGS